MNQNFEIAESMAVSVEVNVVSGYDSLISAVSMLQVTKDLMDEATQDIVLRCNELIGGHERLLQILKGFIGWTQKHCMIMNC
jgi:hypothetical protein